MKTSLSQPTDLPTPSTLITVSLKRIKTSIKPDGQQVLPVSHNASWNVMPKLNVVVSNGTRAGGMDQNAICLLPDGPPERLLKDSMVRDGRMLSVMLENKGENARTGQDTITIA